MFRRLRKILFGEKIEILPIEPQEIETVPETEAVEPKINAFISKFNNHEISKALAQSQNVPRRLTIHDGLKINPSKVYMYNLSAMSYTVDTSIGTVTFKGRPEKHKKEWFLTYTLPSVLKRGKTSVDHNHLEFVFENGRRLAMDMIDPENPTLNQDLEIDRSMSGNRNLGEKGVFWSEHYPPKPEEVKAARKRMIKFYTKLVRQVAAFEKLFALKIKNPKFIEECANQKTKWDSEKLVNTFANAYAREAMTQMKNLLTPEHYVAAEYLGVKAFWAKPIKETQKK